MGLAKDWASQPALKNSDFILAYQYQKIRVTFISKLMTNERKTKQANIAIGKLVKEKDAEDRCRFRNGQRHITLSFFREI